MSLQGQHDDGPLMSTAMTMTYGPPLENSERSQAKNDYGKSLGSACAWPTATRAAAKSSYSVRA